jgi:hypothetical protein
MVDSGAAMPGRLLFAGQRRKMVGASYQRPGNADFLCFSLIPFVDISVFANR